MPTTTALSFVRQIFAILQPPFRKVKIDSKHDGVRLVETEWNNGVWKRREIKGERFSTRKGTPVELASRH